MASSSSSDERQCGLSLVEQGSYYAHANDRRVVTGRLDEGRYMSIVVSCHIVLITVMSISTYHIKENNMILGGSARAK